MYLKVRWAGSRAREEGWEGGREGGRVGPILMGDYVNERKRIKGWDGWMEREGGRERLSLYSIICYMYSMSLKRLRISMKG